MAKTKAKKKPAVKKKAAPKEDKPSLLEVMVENDIKKKKDSPDEMIDRLYVEENFKSSIPPGKLPPMTPKVLKVKLLHPKAFMPELATDGAAGYDLVATEVNINHPQDRTMPSIFKYKFGIAIEIPKGYVGLLFPRSSIVNTGMVLANSVGVIDSDYRGEIMAVFTGTLKSQRYIPGDRAIQLVIIPLATLETIQVDELSKTTRGDGAFGSTGSHGNTRTN